jgi:N-acetylglucosaminyl-diphospho-decaprenol L-rhamnosyltransferase
VNGHVNPTHAAHNRSEMPGSPPRLTVVIVNYQSWPDVLRLTSSLLAEPEFQSGRCQIVVVDNASGDQIPELFLSHRPGLRLVAQPENWGFAAGVNAGWRAAQDPWLLILHPDVEVGKGFLAQLCARLNDYADDPDGPPGIVGFGLKNPDGSPQGSVGVFPNLARTVWEQFIPRSRRKYQAGWRIRSGQVDWVTGACMLINANMISTLGGMDEDFFLYYEEVAFSRAAQRQGWRVEYDAGVTVVHRHPLQNRPISPKMRVITRHSKLLYFLKHLPRRQFAGLCAIVRMEAAVRGFWARALSKHDDGRAWRTIGEIAHAMRTGVVLQGRDVRKLAESAANFADDLGRSSPPALSGSHKAPSASLSRERIA